MIRASIRPGAVSIPSKVRNHHGVGTGKLRGYPVPHDMGLGISVEQQYRGSTAAYDAVDVGAAGLYGLAFKPLEHDENLLSLRLRKSIRGNGTSDFVECFTA
jgi:hypothetical protein